MSENASRLYVLRFVWSCKHGLFVAPLKAPALGINLLLFSEDRLRKRARGPWHVSSWTVSSPARCPCLRSIGKLNLPRSTSATTRSVTSSTRTSNRACDLVWWGIVKQSSMISTQCHRLLLSSGPHCECRAGFDVSGRHQVVVALIVVSPEGPG